MIQIYCFKFVLEMHGEDESSNKPKEGTLFQCFTISSYNYILISTRGYYRKESAALDPQGNTKMLPWFQRLFARRNLSSQRASGTNSFHLA
jgi:hypothetical protein